MLFAVKSKVCTNIFSFVIIMMSDVFVQVDVHLPSPPRLIFAKIQVLCLISIRAYLVNGFVGIFVRCHLIVFCFVIGVEIGEFCSR